MRRECKSKSIETVAPPILSCCQIPVLMVIPTTQDIPCLLRLRRLIGRHRLMCQSNFPFPFVFRLFLLSVTLITNKTPLSKVLKHPPSNPHHPYIPFSFICYLTDRPYLTGRELTSAGRLRWNGGREVPLTVALSAHCQRQKPNLTWLLMARGLLVVFLFRSWFWRPLRYL